MLRIWHTKPPLGILCQVGNTSVDPQARSFGLVEPLAFALLQQFDRGVVHEDGFARQNMITDGIGHPLQQLGTFTNP